MSAKFFKIFCSAYNLNYEALTTIKDELDSAKRRVPFIGEGIAGTDMELNVADQPLEQEYIDVGDLLKDSEAAFIVYGNSMTPAYPPGVCLGYSPQPR